MALLDSLLQSNSPAANILTNAGQVFGQGLARRGGLLGLPLGALIGGTAQAALQQRQLGIQKTLADQIRQQAELTSDPAEREQMNSAAAIAEAGGDPSSLLHTTGRAAQKGTFYKEFNKDSSLKDYFNPGSGERVPAGEGVYAQVQKAPPSANTPFAAFKEAYLATHPGDDAGAANYAQQQVMRQQIAVRQATERPEYSRVQLGDKVYTYDVHNPGSMRLLGNAPPRASDADSFTPITMGGTPDKPGEVYAFSHKKGGIVGAALGPAPLKGKSSDGGSGKDDLTFNQRLAGLPKTLKDSHTFAPSTDVPGAIVARPMHGATEPGTGYFGSSYGAAPAKTKLIMPDGTMISAGSKIKIGNRIATWTP